MISNIFQKAALFGASTVAGVALSGTIMANSAQAGTMSYRSEFSVTSNSLNSEVITGDFSFTKTKLDSGEFSYKVMDFNANVIGRNFTLSQMRANPNPFLALNQALVEEKYQSILPSVLAGENSNYEGDGDFPPEDFSKTFGFDFGNVDFQPEDFSLKFGFDFVNGDFQPDNFDLVFNGGDLLKAGPLVSNIFPSISSEEATVLLVSVLGEGGTINFATTTVPEPTTIFGIGVLGVGLIATGRRSRSKKIKQKIAT